MKNLRKHAHQLLVVLIAVYGETYAASVPMDLLDASGHASPIGAIEIEPTPYGVLLTPKLTGLPPGLHGFHVHEHANCGPTEVNGKPVAGGAAGGHYDPARTGKHLGPWGEGHLGDLPALYVDTNGNANYPVVAPRLRMADLKGRSLMIHAGGDNHSDHPAALGGGGARLVCGVIQ